MSKISNPHDHLFRSAMADRRVAHEFFETHLPASIQQVIDFNSLSLRPNTYIDRSLKLTASDVLYQVNIAGEIGYLYILAEHQSTCDPIMPFRIWQYMIGIWDDHLKQMGGKTLPLIVPLVFYTGQSTYTGSTDIQELIQAPQNLIEQMLFQQTFQLIDLQKIEDETLRQQLWAGALGLTMKHIRRKEIKKFLEEILQLLHQLEQSDGVDYVVSLLEYLLHAGETSDIPAFVSTVSSYLSHNTGEKVMTIAEQLIEKGVQQGMQQGIHQGEHLMLEGLLKYKFHAIPTYYQKLLEQADEATLLKWSYKVIDAKTLQEIFEE